MTLEPAIEAKKSTKNIFSGDSNLDNEPFLEIPKIRKCTDTFFLLIFVLVFVLLISLSGVFSVGTNMNRFLYGYDGCGDTCGSNNSQIRGINCSGKDLTNKRIALMQYYSRCPLKPKRLLSYECIESCRPPYQLMFHRCFPPCKVTLDAASSNKKQMIEVLHAFDHSLSTITIMSIAGIVLSLIIVICFGFNAVVTFWALVILQLIILLTTTSLLWHKYFTADEFATVFLLFAVTFTGYLIFLSLFIIHFQKKLETVFEFYQEAMNAIFRIPSLLLQPVLTIVAITFTLTSMIFLIFLISSNEHLIYGSQFTVAQYIPRASTILYIFYSVVMMIWIFEFFNGCQTMIISDAVSTYYFTRNKTALSSPHFKSVVTLIRFHLGSVFLGSLLMTLFSFMRGIAEYFVNKAYIQTAMHGTSLMKSNRAAIKILCSNLTNSAVLTGFSYIVITGSSLFAILMSAIVGILLSPGCTYASSFWLGILFGTILTGIMTFIVMGLINAATETIFMCFCEDRTMNDGTRRPYYMSERLQKMLENSNLHCRHSAHIEPL